MIRVFTPLWTIAYLALTPIIAFKYTADVMLAFFNDVVFVHLEIPDRNGDCLPSFKGQQSLFARAGFWLWGSLLFPLFYIVFMLAAVLYRTWMLLYGTVHMCTFRSRYEGDD